MNNNMQQLFNGITTLMVAKFIMNDVPHAAGLLTNPGTSTGDSWDNVWKSCVQAAKILGKELTEQDIPGNWDELRRLHKDLWAQVYGERHTKQTRNVDPHPPRKGVIPKLPEEAHGDFLFFEYVRDMAKYKALSEEDVQRMWEAWGSRRGR